MQTLKTKDQNHLLEESAQRLLLMEESLHDYMETKNREFNNLREEVLKCERSFLDNKTARSTRLTSLLTDLEHNMETIETTMSNNRKTDSEIMLKEYCEEKFGYISNELSAEKNLRETDIMHVNQSIKNKFKEIEDQVKNEGGEREEGDQTINKKLTEDMAILNNTILNEKSIVYFNYL